MNKKIVTVLGLCILALAIIGVIFIRIRWTDNLPVHNLRNGLGYRMIQEAIAANETKNGDSILVKVGNYSELITISKSLKIVGENVETTIIDGKNVTNPIDIAADNVTITGFTIRNSGGSGLTLTNVMNCNISGNCLKSNYYGIRFTYASDAIIVGNNFTGNNVGLLLVSASNNNVSKNDVIGNHYGIELTSSSKNTISENGILRNSEGVALYLSSNNNSVYENVLKNNTWGIELALSLNNKIFHNDFINNTKQAYLYSSEIDYPNTWDDGYPSGGNFWSDYSGLDSNGDGIGELSYQINANNTDNFPLMQSYATPESAWNFTPSMPMIAIPIATNFRKIET